VRYGSAAIAAKDGRLLDIELEHDEEEARRVVEMQNERLDSLGVDSVRYALAKVEVVS
jgi:hypothetical protein